MFLSRLVDWKPLCVFLTICYFASCLPSIASFITIVYVLPKTKFEEYCKIAELVPKSQAPERSLVPMIAVAGRRSETLKEKRLRERADRAQKFLDVNGKEPYKYNWSGIVLMEVLKTLKEVNGIDLMERSIRNPDDYYDWYVFDEGIKTKYLDKLNPSNFTAKGLEASFIANEKREREETKRDFQIRSEELLTKGKITKEQLKQLVGTMEVQEAFPERGKAMMDSVIFLHRYLQFADRNNMVILQIVQ